MEIQKRYINRTAKEYLSEGEPVLSIDCKKKENLGNFKNNGHEYCHKKSPRKVLDHDFLIKELGSVAPYGVYDVDKNTGFVNLGLSHDTAEFAVNSIMQWWLHIGKETYPHAKRLSVKDTRIRSAPEKGVRKRPRKREFFRGNMKNKNGG